VNAPVCRQSPAILHLTPAEKPAIYVDWIGRNRNQMRAECTAAAPDGGTIAVRPVAFGGIDFVSDDGQHRWLTTYELKVSQAGNYELTCRPGVSHGPTHYGIGDNPDTRGEAVKAFGGFAADAVGTTGGIAIGVLIALVVGLRRGAHRRRLERDALR
jgi:hypothetical protein